MDILKLFLSNPSICTDTRKLLKGDIFFALKGDNFNGNKFAIDALNNGASFAIVDEIYNDGEDYRIIRVENVLMSLQKLAYDYRIHLGIPVIAITGSNGKTTTKELLAAVLETQYTINYTKGNLNNEIGVPLTILSTKPNAQLLIVEMGANHQGEIALLSSIAAPDYGIITNIGRAHLEGFGGPQGVIKGKTELYNYLEKSEGTIFLNSADEILVDNAPYDVKKINYNATKFKILEDTPYLVVENDAHKISTHLAGKYNLANIAAATTIGLHFNISMDNIKSAISNYKPDNNRSQLTTLGDVQIIKDAYNANPSSVMSSITSFLAENAEAKVVILGDMLELGEYASAEHRLILDTMQKYSVYKAIYVGPLYYEFKNKYNGDFYQSVVEAKPYVDFRLFKNKTVLLKGSRGIALEKLLDNK
jgi:UDP-N-acetylmuramoyl-tripeptide--D-alanyl-D-alanine ligase